MNYIESVAVAIERAIPEGNRPTVAARSLYRLYALLALTRGSATTLENVHDAWSVWITERGAVHESLVPFDELDTGVQLEDRVYLVAIHSVAANLPHF